MLVRAQLLTATFLCYLIRATQSTPSHNTTSKGTTMSTPMTSTPACSRVRTKCILNGTFLSGHSDEEWTKEETDYLFNLVREYDNRWYIVHDRYEYPDGAQRSLEVTAPV